MITAFLLGLVGGLHCMGMCGPLVLALPRTEGSRRWLFWLGRLVYNSGRTVTYVLLGIVFGAAGQIISLAGFQSTLSIVLGVIVLLSLVMPLTRRVYLPVNSEWWKKTVGALFRKKSITALGLIGVLNGFLPCGLVYTALAGAVASGSIASSAGFMFFFGVGTIPSLLLVSALGYLTKINWQRLARAALPAAVAVIGVLLILRGLSLGVPFISPDLSPIVQESAPDCH